MSKQVLLIMGSPRLGGNTAILSELLSKQLEKVSIKIMSVNIKELVFEGCEACKKCINDGRCKKDDDMQQIYPLIKESDCIAMLSPVYNYNITSELKAFIDRMFCCYDFTSKKGVRSRLGYDKKACIIANCAGKIEASAGVTMDAMRLPLTELGYQVVKSETFFGVTQKILHNNPEINNRIQLIADEIVRSIQA